MPFLSAFGFQPTSSEMLFLFGPRQYGQSAARLLDILKVKNKIIYIAENLQVGLFNNLTYDFGADPALDSF